MTDKRETTTRNVAWFLDLRRREGGLILDPPYQRRSVWNQKYRDYFIETVLLDLPSPAIFLFEHISEEGALSYSVVDGKQRLTTIFDFTDGAFPVADNSKLERLRDTYFPAMESDDKQLTYSYTIPIEILPKSDEEFLDEIFDRINRNVARLTPQELRHAKFGGVFATAVDELTAELSERLPTRFPNIADGSRRQMKDAEFTALLLLLVENGPESTPQQYLDEIYAEREDDWENRRRVTAKFRRVLNYIGELADHGGATFQGSRLRNQGDFYALFGAIATLTPYPQVEVACEELMSFVAIVGDDAARVAQGNERAKAYYDAARSAANDPRQRAARIEILRGILEEL